MKRIINDNSIEIFMPAGDGCFKFELRRIAIPFTDGGTRQNQDLWRLYELYLYDKEGNNKIYDFPVCNKGEWELAVKIKDTPDFHGGYHGYEHLTDFGYTVNEGSFEFFQDSKIYLQGTRDTHIADHKKRYVFENGKLTLTQYVKWHKTLPVDRSFITMLPVRRNDGDFQITDTAVLNGVEYDVSHENHAFPLDNKNVRTASIYGKKSGIRMSVSVDFDNLFFVQNTPAYNKFYFKNAYERDVIAGEEWNTKSVYAFEWRKNNDTL